MTYGAIFLWIIFCRNISWIKALVKKHFPKICFYSLIFPGPYTVLKPHSQMTGWCLSLGHEADTLTVTRYVSTGGMGWC